MNLQKLSFYKVLQTNINIFSNNVNSVLLIKCEYTHQLRRWFNDDWMEMVMTFFKNSSIFGKSHMCLYKKADPSEPFAKQPHETFTSNGMR